MQQIVNFIIRNKTFLLFFLLFIVSLIFTIQSHSYHKSKFINSANLLTGGIYKSANDLTQYLNLKHQNEILAEENSRLNSIIFNFKKDAKTEIAIDSNAYFSAYTLRSANIIKNSYALTNNVLLINKGSNDSLAQDMGVINPKGIIGILDNLGKKYSTVISILNTNVKLSAQLKKTNHFGTLNWNGRSPEYTQLVDVPKIAPIVKGDTIITSGRSSIFPKGIPIGVIESFELDAAENYYEINVKLFNDMTNIEHVYIIENKESEEINDLINPLDE